MERFWAKVQKTEECWEWTAATVRGYGVINLGGTLVYAHRFAFEAERGRIPEGMQIDHLCRNRPCVNPRHLEAVTQRTNLMRGQSGPAKNAKKTHCPKGHPLVASNLLAHPLKKHGWRVCATCSREREVIRAATRKAERHAKRAERAGS